MVGYSRINLVTDNLRGHPVLGALFYSPTEFFASAYLAESYKEISKIIFGNIFISSR